MDDVDSPKKKIDELEVQIVKEREAHELKLRKIKTENYEALEASQTRYQGELEIQRRNFQRQVEKLRAKLESFEV
jgi:predicted RND superfamily exporter protein